MALYGIGQSRANLYTVHEMDVYNLALEGEITITREKNSASVLTATIKRGDFPIEVGDPLKFVLDDNHHQFFGYIIDMTLKSDGFMDVTAYDQLYYLAKSKTCYTYKDLTAREVLKLVCDDCELNYDYNSFEETGYKIPYRIEENVTYLDVICNALEATKENTNTRFYIWDNGGEVMLTQNVWLAGETSNVYYPSVIEDYTIKKSLNDDFYTAVRINETLTEETTDKEKKKDDKPKTELEQQEEKLRLRKVHTARNEDGIKQYGYIEYCGTLEEGENGDNKAKMILEAQGAVKEEISLSGAQGDITVRGGSLILIDLFSEGRKEYIRGWFEVESVTHHIGMGYHSMDLTCKLYDKMYDDWGVDSKTLRWIDIKK